MAEINTINLNGTNYDVADASARLQGSANATNITRLSSQISGKQDAFTFNPDDFTFDDATNTVSIKGGATLVIDSTLSSTSTNPVQNRVITVTLATKQDLLASSNDVTVNADGTLTIRRDNLIDAALSATSTNAVQNNVLYTTITGINTAITTVNQAVNLLNEDSSTVGSVDYKIAQALASTSSISVVNSLPATGDSNVIYVVLGSPNKMYVYHNNVFTPVNDYTTQIANLQTTVGDSTSGLVKDVADNTAALETVNGTDTGSSMRDVAEDVVSSIPKAITPKGTIEFADLPALADSSVGDMYNIEDAFTTTADFIMGAGTEMQANSNVYVIDVGSGEKKWDVFATGGIADMSAYQTKELTSHSGITATTVEGALEEVASNIADVEGDVSDLQTTVGNATNGLVKDVADLDTAKQPKTLSSPITVDDVQQTTVEGALTALANASGGGVTDEVAGHILLWYAAVADLPTTTAGAIITGTRAWVAADNQLYVATVTGTSVTWAVDSTYHLAVGSDYFHGTASTSQLNITSVGK